MTRRDNHDLRVLGRLQQGLTLAEAQARLDVVSRQLEQQYPATNKTVHARLIPERRARPEPNAADSNPLVAGVFLLLVSLVLLVACVNVVNLLMVTSDGAASRAGAARRARRRAQTSRPANARRESCAGIAWWFTGAIIGRWLSAMLSRIKLPADLPIGSSWCSTGECLPISACRSRNRADGGLLPALRAARTDLNEVLREGGRSMADGGRRQRVRSALVIAQVAVSLVCWSQLACSFEAFSGRVRRFWFRSAACAQPLDGCQQQGLMKHRDDRSIVRSNHVAAVPGVESVSYAYAVPFGYYSSAEYVESQDHPSRRINASRRPDTTPLALITSQVMKVPMIVVALYLADDENAHALWRS